jgi:dienelactone hydrolase
LLAATLGACATRPDQVDVRVGIDFPYVEGAADYAALYAPYAMMATAAYANENVLGAPNHCPDVGKLGVPQAGDDAETVLYNRTLRDWVRSLNHNHWECRFGVLGSLPCPRRLGPDCKPVGGLGFQVWRRMQRGVCREVAIAFRGTDRHDSGDWTSNFRFLYRLIPRFDQYDQVRTHIRQVVARIKRNGCGGKDTLFVATGHSLGGGLAQQAAYADGTIRYVYAFDSSPITGIFDVSAIVRERNTRGLGVDRAYEAGEILILPRLLIENIVPPWPCNPRVRTVRFNVLSGSPLAQHSINELTAKLREVATTPGADPRRADAERVARDCAAPPFMEWLAPPA